MTFSLTQISGFPPRSAVRRLRTLGIALAGSVFFLAVAIGAQAGDIVGKVTSKDGTEVANATVTAKLLGRDAGSSVSTDRNGAFRIESLGPGLYTVAVRCPKCGAGISKQVEIKGAETVEVNLPVGVASHEQTTSGGSLGPVRLDTGTPFQQSQLKNPSGGGGYSNSATMQADSLYHQYLLEPASPGTESSSSQNQKSSGKESREGVAVEREGKELLAQGKYQEAIRVFQQGADQNPRSGRIHEGLGVSLFSAGRYAEAVRAYIQATKLTPDDSRLIVELSEAAGFAPEPAAAAMLRNFVDAHPQNSSGHYALGYYEWKIFLADHDTATLDAARAHFKNTLALEPRHAAAHLYLGMTEDELGKTREAVENYKAAIEADPLLATAHYRLGRDYQRLGDKSKAAEEFSQFQKLTSSSPQ